MKHNAPHSSAILEDTRRSTDDQAEIERLLTSVDGLNRWAAAQNPNFQPNPTQLKRGLDDPSPNVAAIFASRFKLSDEEVERCVRSDSPAIQMAVARRTDIKLNEGQWVSLLLNSNHQVVVEAFKRKEEFPEFLPEEPTVARGLGHVTIVSDWFRQNVENWRLRREARDIKAHLTKQGFDVEKQRVNFKKPAL